MTKNFNIFVFFLISLHLSHWSCAQLNEIKYSKTFELPQDPKIEQKAMHDYQSGNYEKAQINFFKTIEKSNFEKISYLYFANALSAKGKNALALEFHQEYLKSLNGLDFNRGINLFNQLNELKVNENLYVSKGKLEGGSFTTFFDNKLFIAQSGQIHSFLITPENNLEYYQREFEKFKNYYLTSVAFLNQGLLAIFGVIDEENKKSTLYFSEFKKNKWSKLKVIPSIDKKLNAAFPANNPKSNKLFFSLDTKDGIGGYDLFFCIYDNGSWTKPLNLGNNINTSGNEIMPFVQEEKLYFSSNGNPSFGGYDIFSISLNSFNEDITNEIIWNTKRDDLSLLILPKENYIFTSFDDSVYAIEILRLAKQNKVIEITPTTAMYSITIQDIAGKPIPDAIVLLNYYSSQGTFFKVDNMGYLKLPNNYSAGELPIKIISDGYFSVNLNWNLNKPLTVQLISQNQDNFYSRNPKENIAKTENNQKSNNIVNEESNSSYERVIVKSRTTGGTPTEKKIEKTVSKSNTIGTTIPVNSAEITEEKMVEKKDNFQEKKSVSVHKSTQNSINISSPDSRITYVIVASTSDPKRALVLCNKYSGNFENLKILEYHKNLYRIGFDAGSNHHQVSQNLKAAREIVFDAWLLKP